jgi:hypothetical protein
LLKLTLEDITIRYIIAKFKEKSLFWMSGIKSKQTATPSQTSEKRRKVNPVDQSSGFETPTKSLEAEEPMEPGFETPTHNAESTAAPVFNTPVKGNATSSSSVEACTEDEDLAELFASNSQPTPPRAPRETSQQILERSFTSKGFKLGSFLDHPVIVAPITMKSKLVGLIVTGSWQLGENKLVRTCSSGQVNSQGESLLQLTGIPLQAMKLLLAKCFTETPWKDYELFKQFGVVASSCYPLHVGRCVGYYDGMGLTEEEKLFFRNASGFPQPTTAQEVADRRAACQRLIVELEGTNNCQFTCISKPKETETTSVMNNPKRVEYKRKVRIINFPIEVESCELLERLLCFTVSQ